MSKKPVSKEKEKILKESQQRYERMLNVVPDLISIHDPDMNILYSNWQGFGAVPEEKRIFHTKCYMTYRNIDHICPDCHARSVLDTGLPFQQEVELPDGRWVDLKVIPVVDQNGNVEMFMEWVRDITDARQARDELESQKKLLEGVLDSIKDVIVVQLPDHTVLQYNRAGYELLGANEEAINGQKCYELIGRTQPCEICATSRACHSKTLETVEKFIPEFGRHFLCSSNPIFDTNGNIKLIIEQLTDITEKKKMDERLQQAQKMESIGSLAGGIAHDFNNILFPIIGLSEIMLEDFPSDSPEYQNALEIYRAGKRGSELIKQILSFSRQSAHRQIPVQIQRVLKEVLKLCRATIPTDIEISLDIRQDCGHVMADPTQIHQIAMNLITNAYHAVEPTSGNIFVQLKEIISEPDLASDIALEPGRYAMLTVSDTGTGIDPEIMNKIFDPYFTTKKKGRGTGLGLATVYGIVKEYGGEIRVYSEEAKGSTFNVFLPAINPPEKPKTKAECLPIPTGTESILLIDDEKSIIRLEKQILERLGYRITFRTSSVEALALFRADPFRFDLIVTDMNMPGKNGLQLAKEMIAVRQDIPIIICTGFSERINGKKAETIGIKGFLMKPVIRSEMAQKIRQVLDEAQPHSE